MNRLKDYVNWKLTHADKTAEAEGYPLVLENCKSNKRMKQLIVYGNSVDGIGVGEKTVNIADMSIFADNACVDNGDGTYTITKGNTKESGLLYIDIEAGSFIRASCNFECVNTTASYLPLQVCYTNGRTTTMKLYNNKIATVTATAQIKWFRIVMTSGDPIGAYYVFKNLMISADAKYDSYEPYGKYKMPLIVKGDNTTAKHNMFLSKPLYNSECYVDIKNKKAVHSNDGIVTEEVVNIELPVLTAKATVVEVDTSIAPSNMYGKYIKR